MLKILLGVGSLLVVSCGRGPNSTAPTTAAGQPTSAPAQSAPTHVATAPAVPSEGMIRIPGGTFTMGSNEHFLEVPPHSVTVNSFEMDRTEVTVAAYEVCVREGVCEARSTVSGTWYEKEDRAPKANKACNWGKPERAQHPMNCVDSNDAGNYCRWVGKRLPTEEEWEFAARGPESRIYPWGNDALESQLCWKRESEDLGTCAVGDFPKGASPLGLMDMLGNVSEWTSSHSSQGYNEKRNPVMLVDRGGGWSMFNTKLARASMRGGVMPLERSNSLGFRCARCESGFQFEAEHGCVPGTVALPTRRG